MSYELYGKIRDFDDGHVPEIVPNATTRILSYSSTPMKHSHVKDLKPDAICLNSAYKRRPTIQVYDEALPVSLCQAIYDVTINHDIPWGTYVTKQDAMDTIRESSFFRKSKEEPTTKSIQELAIQAVAHFIFRNVDNPDVNVIHGERLNSLNTDNRIHGVQVWALASHNDSFVPYHIDYAEYIRYTENMIVTPIVAGTIQCTGPETSRGMEGGTFAVNVGGLDHYKKFGYKGCLMKSLASEEQRLGGWTEPQQSNRIVVDTKSGWVSIPYKYNQGILHTGDLPHLSSKVRGLSEGTKRVIVGFNVFCHDIGKRVMEIPEHSTQFRRMVKFHRVLAKFGPSQGLGENLPRREVPKVIPLKYARKNKSLMKLLVLAKREKVKHEWQKTQKWMTEWIYEQLKYAGNDGIIVGELLKQWDISRHSENVNIIGIKPSVDDMLVHIDHLLKDSKIRVASLLDEKLPLKEVSVALNGSSCKFPIAGKFS